MRDPIGVCHIELKLALELPKTQAVGVYALEKYGFARKQVPSHSLASLVDLLNGWATAATTTAWHTTAWHTTLWHAATTGSLIDLHHDRIHDPLELLLLSLEFILFGHLFLVEPIQRVLDSFLDFLFVPSLEFVLELVVRQSVAHLEAVVLQAVLRLNFHLVRLIFCFVLLCLLHHAVDLRLRQPTLFVGDGDLIRLTTGLVLGRNIQDTVRVDIKSDLDLGHSTWSWRNSVQVELAQQVVVFRHRTLALENLDEHPWLVVGVSREGLALLCWDGRVSFNEFRHHASCSFEAHLQWSDIQQQQVL